MNRLTLSSQILFRTYTTMDRNISLLRYVQILKLVASFFLNFEVQKKLVRIIFISYFFIRILASSKTLTIPLLPVEAWREYGSWRAVALLLGR
jgi:hypothetical protein